VVTSEELALQSRVNFMRRYGLVPRTTNGLFSTALRYDLVRETTNAPGSTNTNAPADLAPLPAAP
jgi:hypothetical protein